MKPASILPDIALVTGRNDDQGGTLYIGDVSIPGLSEEALERIHRFLAGHCRARCECYDRGRRLGNVRGGKNG